MKKTKILITEDEFVVSQNLKNKLSSLGYDVIGTVSSGEDALDKIKQNRPDLILMDIMLAGKMDGIETAKIIKSKYNIPLIFLTAYSSKEIYQRAEITEPYAYIIKPFEERELEINISIALYKHRAEEKLKEKQKSLEVINENLDRMVQERTIELIIKNDELKKEIEDRIKAQENESRLAEVIKQAEDQILITNIEGEIEYLNPKMLSFTGYNEKEIYGKSPRILKSNKHPESFYEILWKTILSGNIFRGEFVNKKKNGELFNTQAIIIPLLDSKNNITHFASISREITEKKKYEKNMIYGIENEKERISKELHDGIGQSITATKYSLMGLLKQLDLPKNETMNIKNIITQTDNLTKELRTISFNLLPSILKDYGLKSAISKTINNIKEHSKIKISLMADSLNTRLDDTIELGLYRITQEVLNNALKHSKADLIDIEIIKKLDNVKLIIADNGIGFDPLKVKFGQGISNIKQRTSLMDGSFILNSDKKKGTQIIVEVQI